jgi:hypothetical protein
MGPGTTLYGLFTAAAVSEQAARDAGTTMAYDYRRDPTLGPVLAYWAVKRRGRAMPRKRDIDPTEIPSNLLPNIQLLDVIAGGGRFRYRLVGTASVEAYGKDYTGSYPDELFSDDRLNFVLGIYKAVCTSKAPVFSRNKYHTPKHTEIFASRIYMPLSDDGIEVSHILGILRFESVSLIDNGSCGDGATLDPAGQYIEPIAIDRLAGEAAD